MHVTEIDYDPDDIPGLSASTPPSTTHSRSPFSQLTMSEHPTPSIEGFRRAPVHDPSASRPGFAPNTISPCYQGLVPEVDAVETGSSSEPKILALPMTEGNKSDDELYGYTRNTDLGSRRTLPALSLQIDVDPECIVKWDLVRTRWIRNLCSTHLFLFADRYIFSINGWQGNNWKVNLTLSYDASLAATGPLESSTLQLDALPSFTIRDLSIVCTLVSVGPLKPTKTFQISYPKPKQIDITHAEENPPIKNSKLHTKEDRTPSITKDHSWGGPSVDSVHPARISHHLGVYIPIPYELFKQTPSRLFNIDAEIQISVACEASDTFVQTARTVEFSHFVEIGEDDGKRTRML